MSVSVSNYPQDFATADPVGMTPVDPQVFLGAEPLIVLLIVLVVLLAASGGWWWGGSRERDRWESGDVVDQIYKALLGPLAAAMRANSNELPTRAQAVYDAFQRVLGPVLELCWSTGPLKDLKTALVGDAPKPKDDKKDAPKHGCACGHGHGEKGCDSGAAAHASAVVVVVGAAETRTCGCPPGPAPCHCAPKADAKPEAKPDGPKKMTTDERNEALRKAIQKLYDHWSSETERKAELREARRALTLPPPKPAAGHHDDHRGGWRFGD